MPYIPDHEIRACLTTPHQLNPTHVGELNYLITWTCHQYLKMKGVSYSNINEVIGVLECAKLEMYRQIASPYEDIKKKDNGAVSELDDVKGEN